MHGALSGFARARSPGVGGVTLTPNCGNFWAAITRLSRLEGRRGHTPSFTRGDLTSAQQCATSRPLHPPQQRCPYGADWQHETDADGIDDIAARTVALQSGRPLELHVSW